MRETTTMPLAVDSEPMPHRRSRLSARRMVAVVVFSILALAVAAAPAFAERVYKTQLTGTPTGGGGSEVPFTKPWGLSIDSEDNVWVADPHRPGGAVDEFRSSGELAAQGFGPPFSYEGGYIQGVAWNDAADSLFVADSGKDDLWVLNAAASVTSDIKGEGATWGGNECCFIFAAADNSAGVTKGDVYVTSNGGGPTLPAVTRVDKEGGAAAFSASAEYIKGNQITGTPTGGGGAEVSFTEPWGATVDSSGNLYVVDKGSNAVDEFASSGEFIRKFTGMTGAARAAAVDPTSGNLLVAAGSAVDEFAPGGELLGETDGSETPAGSFGEARGVTVNSLGVLYVSDSPNHVVDVFGPSVPPRPKQPLTVETTGAGVGSVTSSPAGISCGSTCSHEFIEGKTVRLTATPNSKSAFVGWSGGGCSGSGICEVTMSAARTVKAEFAALPQRVLNVEVNNPEAGTVASSPEGIECGAACSAEFNEGSTVTLTPAPAAGFMFVGWSGCTKEAGEACEIEMSAEETVKAEFVVLPKFELNVTEAGTGKGAVASAPSGINCEPEAAGICGAEFTLGETVFLTASPAANSQFVKWSGCTREAGGGCEVAITAEATVTAEFAQYAPIVTTEPASGVTSAAATLVGNVNPRGAATSACRFVYGTSTAYGSEVACEPGSLTGSTTQEVKATIASLAPHTTYHYKLIAVNAGGEAGGSDATFQTPVGARELEEEAAAPRIQREQEEATGAAQGKRENEAAARQIQQVDAVLNSALAEALVFNPQQEAGHGAAARIVTVKAGARGVTLTLQTAQGGAVTITGRGLKTTTKSVAAGTHQLRVLFTAAGRRARARGAKIRLTVRITVSGKTTSMSKTVKL